MTATDLQAQWGIAGALAFEDGEGGLTRAVIATPQATATVYLYGAHVTSWAPAGHRPVLYTSSRSAFELGKPIRGGVPIVFPWFGPRAGEPMHGFARISDWQLEGAHLRADGSIELMLILDDQLRYRVAVGAALELELEVSNHSDQPFHFEEALHTYFSVADINKVVVAGLEGTSYIDKTDGAARKELKEPIRFTRETDQVHLNTTATCEIQSDRTIVVEKSGSQTTVVWNPWIEKNRNLADMAPDDWKTMCCIETANAVDNAIELPPNGSHKMTAKISVALL